MNRFHASLALAAFGSLLFLSACKGADEDQQYPTTEEDRRKERLGKLSGDNGITMLGGDSDDKDSGTGGNPLGVNSFLWRGTLDTLAFMPLISADPWGGTILTDWYEDPEAPGERFKVNALILDRNLRTDSLKISVFRQKKNVTSGLWEDAQVDAGMGRKLEDTVLTRARQLRVKQMGY